jgi:hypothetical protein
MASLLVKVFVVNQEGSPFLSILIPGSVSITSLFFPLDLDPLKHLYSSDESNALVDLDRKMLISYGNISVTLTCTVNKSEIVLPIWLLWESIYVIFLSSTQNIKDASLLSLI